jgi:hypothetical protein
VEQTRTGKGSSQACPGSPNAISEQYVPSCPHAKADLNSFYGSYLNGTVVLRTHPILVDTTPEFQAIVQEKKYGMSSRWEDGLRPLMWPTGFEAYKPFLRNQFLKAIIESNEALVYSRTYRDDLCDPSATNRDPTEIF